MIITGPLILDYSTDDSYMVIPTCVQVNLRGSNRVQGKSLLPFLPPIEACSEEESYDH